jgi:hypothetical protein
MMQKLKAELLQIIFRLFFPKDFALRRLEKRT